MTHLVFMLIYGWLFYLFIFFLWMFWCAKLRAVCLTTCNAWGTDGLFSSTRWHAKMKFYQSNFSLWHFIWNGCFNTYSATHQFRYISFHIEYNFTTNSVFVNSSSLHCSGALHRIISNCPPLGTHTWRKFLLLKIYSLGKESGLPSFTAALVMDRADYTLWPRLCQGWCKLTIT